MQKIIDYSFITFHRSLSDAYGSLNDPQLATIFNRRFVQLGTMDETRQHTNTDFDLNFGHQILAELVDCSDNVLLNVTPNFTEFQFDHSQTGIKSLYWQLKNIGRSFSRPVHLKLTHYAVGAKQSGLVAYSTPFHVQEDVSETTEFDYWSYKLYDGQDYGTTQGRNRIRLRGTYTKPTRATEQQTYTQVGRTGNGQGNVIHNTPTRVLNYNWLVEYYDNHGMEAFESMVNSAVIYVSKPFETAGTRATTIVPSTENVLGSSNFYSGAWVMNIDRTEVYVQQGAIGTAFALVQSTLRPFGSVTLAQLASDSLRGFFNKDITIGTGTLTVWDADTNTLLDTYTQADITAVGTNGFEITSFANTITTTGNYFINFTGGLFVSLIGENYAVPNSTEWTFTAQAAGDFDEDDFDSTDFLT